MLITRHFSKFIIFFPKFTEHRAKMVNMMNYEIDFSFIIRTTKIINILAIIKKVFVRTCLQKKLIFLDQSIEIRKYWKS